MRPLIRLSAFARKNATFIAFWLVATYANMEILDFTPLVVPIAKDFVINYTQIGAIQTATFVPYAALQIVAGEVVDIYSGKRIIVAATALVTLISVLSVLSSTYIEILICRVFLGVATAFVFVPGAKLLRDSVSQREQGTIFGLYGSSFAVGAIGASVLPVVLFDYLQNWRLSLLVLATLGLGVLVLVLTSPAPKKYSSNNRAESKAAAGSFSSVLKKTQNWSLAYDQFVRGGLGIGLSTWIPTYVVQQHGFSFFESGLILGGIWVLALITTPLGGVISDKVRSNFVVIELTLVIVAPAILVLATTTSPSLVWISSLLVGSLMYLNMGPLFATVPRIVESRRLGFAIGLQNMFASLGGLTIPIVLGFFKDSTGAFTSGWFLLAFLAVAGALISVNLRKY